MAKVLNGQPILYPAGESNWESCCDCGLTHMVFYRQEKYGVVQTNFRDDHITMKERKAKPISEWRELLGRLHEILDERGYDFEYTLKRRGRK